MGCGDEVMRWRGVIVWAWTGEGVEGLVVSG